MNKLFKKNNHPLLIPSKPQLSFQLHLSSLICVIPLIATFVFFKSQISSLKGSVQRKLRWVQIGANRWIMAWDFGAGHYSDVLLRHRLALNIFPFPVTTAELIGKFSNDRRSVAHGCPRFAYSFMFLMLRQYYWRCDSYSANRRSAANMKNPRKPYYWRCESVPLRQ